MNVKNFIEQNPHFCIFLYVGVNDNRFPLSVTKQFFQDIYTDRVIPESSVILQDLCEYYNTLTAEERPRATRNPDLYRRSIRYKR